MVEIADNAARTNCAYWATEANVIHLQAGPFSFEDREYLMEPMSSKARRRCYMKGTQGGGSTAEILKSFHGMIYKYYPLGVLYLFPTDSAMQDYSKAVMTPLITANKSAIGKWVKKGKGSSDAASLKTVNGANFFMRGAGLNTLLDGEGFAAMLQGISADKIVFDEIELIDPLALGQAAGRHGNSTVKEEVYIGNPSFPQRGISKVFDESDQRFWFRQCLHCGKTPSDGATWEWYIDHSNGWTCAEQSFPDCVKDRSSGMGFICCMKCGKEVFVRNGRWVPRNRLKSDSLHGYQWSQLTSPNNNPSEILEAFNNPPNKDLGSVYRLKLGKPYISAQDQLRVSQVFDCITHSVMGMSDDGPCAFGLDVGSVKACHLLIGKRIGPKAYQVVKLARLSNWNDISSLVTRFSCKTGVIDSQPEHNKARDFQKNHRMRIFLCQYTEAGEPAVFNPRTGMVKANRTEIFDRTHELVTSPGRLTLPEMSQEVRVFADQVCNPLRKFDDKKGVYRYIGDNDHYRNALNYFLLAAEKLPISSPGRHSRKKYPKVMNDYARI
jgi:hypothetical protein